MTHAFRQSADSSGLCPIQFAWSRHRFVVLCRGAYIYMLTELLRLLPTTTLLPNQTSLGMLQGRAALLAGRARASPRLPMPRLARSVSTHFSRMSTPWNPVRATAAPHTTRAPTARALSRPQTLSLSPRMSPTVRCAERGLTSLSSVRVSPSSGSRHRPAADGVGRRTLRTLR